MQPVPLCNALCCYSHHWLVQALAPFYCKCLATLKELSATTKAITSGSYYALDASVSDWLAVDACVVKVAHAVCQTGRITTGTVYWGLVPAQPIGSLA